MTDCLGDCFERDEENRRVLKLKPESGLACDEEGLYTYPHGASFATRYWQHNWYQGYELSTPNPINTGVVAPASNGIQHTPIAGTAVTNSFTSTNGLLIIEGSADLYIMPRVPLVPAVAKLELKVTLDDVNWVTLQHSSYRSIDSNAAYSSGQIGAHWLIAPGASYTPKFAVFYENVSGAGAAFISATSIRVLVTMHAH